MFSVDLLNLESRCFSSKTSKGEIAERIAGAALEIRHPSFSKEQKLISICPKPRTTYRQITGVDIRQQPIGK